MKRIILTNIGGDFIKIFYAECIFTKTQKWSYKQSKGIVDLYRLSRNSPDKVRPEILQIIFRQFNTIQDDAF